MTSKLKEGVMQVVFTLCACVSILAVALICIFSGCICITTTIILLASSNWDRQVIPYARWVGFTASKWSPMILITKILEIIPQIFPVILFCLAAVIFPLGFNADVIGGQPYQLPTSHQVGLSYIMFVLAVWITVISELFAGKVCLPHF